MYAYIYMPYDMFASSVCSSTIAFCWTQQECGRATYHMPSYDTNKILQHFYAMKIWCLPFVYAIKIWEILHYFYALRVRYCVALKLSYRSSDQCCVVYLTPAWQHKQQGCEIKKTKVRVSWCHVAGASSPFGARERTSGGQISALFVAVRVCTFHFLPKKKWKLVAWHSFHAIFHMHHHVHVAVRVYIFHFLPKKKWKLVAWLQQLSFFFSHGVVVICAYKTSVLAASDCFSWWQQQQAIVREFRSTFASSSLLRFHHVYLLTVNE